MKEQAKSAVLFLLVALSIFLTHRLWFGYKGTEAVAESDYEAVYFEEPRPMMHLLTPEGIVIYQHELCYRVRQDDPDFLSIWEEISEMLQEIDEPATYEYGESLPESAAICLSVQFDPPLPLGWESPWLKNATAGELVGLQIWNLADRCWAILQAAEGSSGLLLLPAKWGSQLAGLCDQFDSVGREPYERLDAGELRLSSGMVLSLAEPVYVPAREFEMRELILKEEALDREALLNAFFIKRDLVREIKERDGGLIYTDGEQGLRLGGGFEYSHPRLEQKPSALSYTAALFTAGKLLGYYGGWPDHLRLQSLHREKGSEAGGIFSAEWRCYFHGYPLLGAAYISMSFHHGGLVNYRRSLYNKSYTSGDQILVRGYREALAAAADLFAGAGASRLTLEKLEPAYYLAGTSLHPQAVPVWVIRLSGRDIVLKADELMPPEGWEQ